MATVIAVKRIGMGVQPGDRGEVIRQAGGYSAVYFAGRRETVNVTTGEVESPRKHARRPRCPRCRQRLCSCEVTA